MGRLPAVGCAHSDGMTLAEADLSLSAQDRAFPWAMLLWDDSDGREVLRERIERTGHHLVAMPPCVDGIAACLPAHARSKASVALGRHLTVAAAGVASSCAPAMKKRKSAIL